MFRLALKNLAANKIRLGLTGFAIVIGVGFVVSSFVLRDGLKDTFNNLGDAIVAGIDLAVSIDEDNEDADPLNDADVATVLAIPGIRAINAELPATENTVQPILDDGTTITLQGPPQLMFNWSADNAINPLTMVEGVPPTEADQWVVDTLSAEEHSFVVGRDYDMITPSGRRTAKLVGVFEFEGDSLGATLMAMETESLKDYALYDDIYMQIQIATDGSRPIADVQADLESAFNTGAVPRVVIKDQASLAADAQADFNQALDIIGGILLGFALVALFVSIFIIAITFSITTSQRTRELGLLRAVGSTPRQILGSVLGESVVIGLIASTLGLGAGVIIAFGIRAAVNAIGLSIPSFDVVIAPNTILIAYLVGTIVTVLSALFPAITASRTSPIAAITGHEDSKEKSMMRFVVGAAIVAAGAGLMGIGLFGGADSVMGVLGPLGAGAALFFIGVTLLSPLVAGRLSRWLGAPIAAVYKTTGRLSKENAARNPRRTATTAAALMIGLSLVSMASVLGDSFKAQFDKILNTTVQADFLVTSDQADIPDEVFLAIDNDPLFGQVTPIKYWDAEFENVPIEPDPDGDLYSKDVTAFDYSQLDGLFNLDVTDGDISAVTNDTVGIQTDVAEDLGLGLGDTLTMLLEDDTTANLEVVAIFDDESVASPVLISFDRFDQISDQKTSDWLAAKVADGVEIADADARFRELAAIYPNLSFDSAAEFREQFASQIDQLLNLLSMLLFLTIVIALLGILNTMALSVFERTREIGLLRAVGMTRTQTRTMIRWEAAIISAVGAVLGAILGVGLGALMVNAIPGDFITEFAIPWTRILLMVVGAAFAGLLAGVYPAFRASRMNVLDAISHE
ncbi:MAG: ABC transporter permease [Acidimicrobiales bacterium]|nr:ABC transporter permease [Acidimicrobiales bacterium]